MIDTRTFAIFAAGFALITIIGLMLFGSETVRKLTLFATLLGTISQFAAQDPRPVARYLSTGAAYLAFAVISAAIILL